MAIKQQPVLTKEDFEVAVVTQRLSVSEVSRETGIPRHIVSHFRNYGDGLKPEQAAKLRDYFVSLGVVFAEEETPTAPQPTGEQPSGQKSLRLPFTMSDDGLVQRTALVCRHFFIDERLTEEQIKEAGKRFKDGYGRVKELLDVDLEREWLSGNYDEDTTTKLRELWGHLAGVGLLSLHLQGLVLVNQDRILAHSFSEGEKLEPKTFGDLLSDTYSETVAGLNASEGTAQAEEAEVAS
ncbi:MAG: hypothetical protein Q7J38_13670 [Gallionella sp.]|nr:hypothetical protein [Gallionella sp.]